MYRLVALAVLISVTACFQGCANYPRSAAVTSFADSTITATTLLQGAAKLDLKLAQRLGYEEAVTGYIRSPKFRGIPRLYPQLIKKQIAVRADLLKSIGAYATALAALNDPLQPPKVGDAVASLGSSVANFIHVQNPNADVSRFAPVTGIISSAAVFYVSQRNAALIKDTAAATHPLLENAVALLIADFGVFDTHYTRLFGELRARQKEKLIAIRSSGTINGIDLEKRYLDNYTADQELAAQLEALRQASDILIALVNAHDDLRKSEDSDRAVGEFKSLVDSIVLHLTEIKKI